MKLVMRWDEVCTELAATPGVIPVGGSPENPWAEVERTQRWCTLLPFRKVTVGGVETPQGLRRLLVPGDRVQWSESQSLECMEDASNLAPAMTSTASVMRSLLGGHPLDAGPEVPRLLCLTGLDLGHSFPLGEPQLFVGRGEDCEVRVRDRAVSRRHARLERREGLYFIHDAGAPNGLFVNGRRNFEGVSLRHGDVIELGRTLLRVFLPEPTPQFEPERAAPSGEKPSVPSLERMKALVNHEWVWAVGSLAIGALGAWWGLRAASAMP